MEDSTARQRVAVCADGWLTVAYSCNLRAHRRSSCCATHLSRARKEEGGRRGTEGRERWQQEETEEDDRYEQWETTREEGDGWLLPSTCCSFEFAHG